MLGEEFVDICGTISNNRLEYGLARLVESGRAE